MSEIAGDVDADAEKIAFGLLINGEGKAYLDDVRLDAVSPGGR